MSFILHLAGAATLSFGESHKATNQTQIGTFRTTRIWNDIIRVGMNNETGDHLDEVIKGKYIIEITNSRGNRSSEKLVNKLFLKFNLIVI